MIKNERQYKITKAHAGKFARSLEQSIQSAAVEEHIHPLLLKAEQDALRSQLYDLRAELEEYEALRSGAFPVVDLDSFAELPRALVKARIAKGLTHKELAERLGLKEQQIQRYEATDYASASLSRIKEVIKALGVKLRENDDIGSQKVSPSSLFKRLREVGLDRDFITKRIIPAPLSARLITGTGEGTDNLCYQIAAHIGRVFGWTPHNILGSPNLRLEVAPAAANFKTATRVYQPRFTAYTVYAHYLALIVVQAMKQRLQLPIPTDPYETRKAILSAYGTLTLAHVLQYIWELGIPVIPLSDPGVFHGACFREGGQNVIVIKQKTSSPSRWMFNILHEMWHASQEPEKLDLTIIEDEDMSHERLSSNEERIASQFAGAVLLGENPQRLTELCLEEAGRDLRMLKSAVQRVASREYVPVDSLADYMAFRLSLEGENWWGTAARLQHIGQNPWLTARDILIEHLDLSKLAEPDLHLLQRALAE